MSAPPKPSLLAFEEQNVPAELRQLRQWVVWRLIWREDQKKPAQSKWTKCPFNGKTGNAAKTDDPATWCTFEEAAAAYQDRSVHRWDGLGFVFSAEDPYCGIDFDKCLDAGTGELLPWAGEHIERLSSYAEISPSSTGVKIIVRGALPRDEKGETRNKRLKLGPDGKGAVELYDRLRFFTVTGQKLPEAPVAVEDRQDVLTATHRFFFPPLVKAPRAPHAGAVAGPVALDDEKLRKKIENSQQGPLFLELWGGNTSRYADDESSADLGLCNVLAYWIGNDPDRIDRWFRRSGLMRTKWDETRPGGTYGSKTIEKALDGRTEFYTPNWSTGRAGARSSNGIPPRADSDPPPQSDADAPGERIDPEQLYTAIGSAENGERSLRICELASALVGDPIRTDEYGNRLREAGFCTKGAFVEAVAEAKTGAKNEARAARIRARFDRRGGHNGVEQSEQGGDEESVSLNDFRGYMLEPKYIYLPTGELWPPGKVNARIPPMPTGESDDDGNEKVEPATQWLDRERPVEQMTWAPGEPKIIPDRLLVESGWKQRIGCFVFNLYHPPILVDGNSKDIEPWWRHLVLLYGAEANHAVLWMAHRAQRPGEKVNHALVFGGGQGIGKDTLLEPLRYAVGPWNFVDVSPLEILGRFNKFRKSVVLRVSEARDLGETDRYAFYEHLKAMTAAPPDYLTIDEKNRAEYAVPNVCGVILTTNHRTGGLHLPADDRRHYVMWSETTRENLPDDCHEELWGWYDAGGRQNVASYLREVSLADFDPKAPPPKTDAFWAMVDAGAPLENGDLRDALEALGNPKAITKEMILGLEFVPFEFKDWLRERRNAVKASKRFEDCGYVAFRNRDQGDGRWKVKGRNMVVYVQARLDETTRRAAVEEFVRANK